MFFIVKPKRCINNLPFDVLYPRCITGALPLKVMVEKYLILGWTLLKLNKNNFDLAILLQKIIVLSCSFGCQKDGVVLKYMGYIHS